MNESGDQRRLFVEFETHAQLEQEYSTRLCHGVAVASTADELQPQEPCVIVLIHPTSGQMLSLGACFSSKAIDGRAVCPLTPFDSSIDEQLREFAGLSSDAPSASPEPEGDVDIEDEPHHGRVEIPATVHQRLRNLPTHEVYRVARNGQLAERVALERIYGKSVWEPLLQNQNLTPPEVARIARMGNLPKPLIETIVAHPGWLSKSLVRRALLSNPRLDGRALLKTLRALPKSELKVVPQQTSYSYRVREAAKRLLG